MIYNEENPEAPGENKTSCQTFQQMLTASGKEVYQLARSWISPRMRISSTDGCFNRPVERCSHCIVSYLNTTQAAFESAMQFALKNPYVGHAKSANTPIVKPRTCEEIIGDSICPLSENATGLARTKCGCLGRYSSEGWICHEKALVAQKATDAE